MSNQERYFFLQSLFPTHNHATPCIRLLMPRQGLLVEIRRKNFAADDYVREDSGYSQLNDRPICLCRERPIVCYPINCFPFFFCSQPIVRYQTAPSQRSRANKSRTNVPTIKSHTRLLTFLSLSFSVGRMHINKM